ncbi:IS5 family transposase [Sphingomonas sp. 36D10-4-7]|uniref:IS5 family transposase n=1 Tax=Sphingomonas corticis TaxID=2722791 RepID=A0ABX1CV47_9SPHN|nr:IS5 family transposase [Sphingomonas corticis]NJR80843.1 IS5 family transposase [Sphingomonas corticis]
MALFWLSDEAWAAIEPHLPKNQPGARRVDDRRVISGILHVLRVGCRWCDCPADYGPSTTVYNPFNRWSHRGFWLKLLDALVDVGAVTRSTAIDSTYVKAQRAAFGAKGGARFQAIGRSRGGWTTKVHALTDVIGRPYALMLTPGNVSDVKAAPALLERAGRMRYLLGDKGYDADRLRRLARDAGAIPVIPGRRNRKRAIRYDKQRYAGRHLIENAFCRLKDFRRVATRYDKLAANFLSGVALATALAFWL